MEVEKKVSCEIFNEEGDSKLEDFSCSVNEIEQVITKLCPYDTKNYTINAAVPLDKVGFISKCSSSIFNHGFISSPSSPSFYYIYPKLFQNFPIEEISLLYQLESPIPISIQLFPGKKDEQEEPISIFVKFLTGKTITLSGLTKYSQISDIKNLLFAKVGVPIDQQRLVFNQQLDDLRTLFQYNITNGSTIHIVVRLLGGMYSFVSGYDDIYGDFKYKETKVNGKQVCYHPSWGVSEFAGIMKKALLENSPYDYTQDLFKYTALSMQARYVDDIARKIRILQQRLLLIQELKKKSIEGDFAENDNLMEEIKVNKRNNNNNNDDDNNDDNDNNGNDDNNDNKVNATNNTKKSKEKDDHFNKRKQLSDQRININKNINNKDEDREEEPVKKKRKLRRLSSKTQE